MLNDALKIGLLALNCDDFTQESLSKIKIPVDEILIQKELFEAIVNGSIDFDDFILDSNFMYSVKSLILDTIKLSDISIPSQWFIVINHLKLLFPNTTSIRVISLDSSVINMEVLDMLKMNKSTVDEASSQEDSRSMITSIDWWGGFICRGITKYNDVVVYHENGKTKFFEAKEIIVSSIWASNQVVVYNNDFIVFRGFIGVSLKGVYEINKNHSKIKPFREFAKGYNKQIKKLSSFMILSTKNINNLNVELANQFKYINPRYASSISFRIKSKNTSEECVQIANFIDKIQKFSDIEFNLFFNSKIEEDTFNIIKAALSLNISKFETLK